MKVTDVVRDKDIPYIKWKESFAETVKKNPGLYNIDEKLYHDSFGLNQSRLKKILKSPAHYKHSIEFPEAPTAAMTFGSAVHKMFFEPHQFNDYYSDIGAIDRRTKVGKAQYEDVMTSGLTPLKSDVLESVKECVESLKANKLAMNLIGARPGVVDVEASAYGYVDNRILSRGRADAIHWERGLIADLKTTSDVMPHSFQKHSFNMGYHIQAAYYLDLFSEVTGNEFDKFVMVCVESSAPYAVQAYVCDPIMIEAGRKLYKEAIDLFLTCTKNNSWPAFKPEILNLTLPKWA